MPARFFKFVQRLNFIIPLNIHRDSIVYLHCHRIVLAMATHSVITPSGPVGLDLDALFTAPYVRQKELLGEVLLPRINDFRPELATNIMAMILEMDNNALIELYVLSCPWVCCEALTNRRRAFDDAALRVKIDELTHIADEMRENEEPPNDEDSDNASERSLPSAMSPPQPQS